MIFTRRKDTRVPDSGPIYLTSDGLDKLKNQLLKLRSILPSLIEETQKAAAYGDRSDNAEYKEAKYNLRRTEGQILNIEDRLKRIVIIRPDERLKGIVQIGSAVTLKRDNGSFRNFQILGRSETNPELGFISNESPLGKIVLGKKLGDKFKFVMPNEVVVEYQIVEIDGLKSVELISAK